MESILGESGVLGTKRSLSDLFKIPFSPIAPSMAHPMWRPYPRAPLKPGTRRLRSSRRQYLQQYMTCISASRPLIDPPSLLKWRLQSSMAPNEDDPSLNHLSRVQTSITT